jgi:hypothetical protein
MFLVIFLFLKNQFFNNTLLNLISILRFSQTLQAHVGAKTKGVASREAKEELERHY